MGTHLFKMKLKEGKQQLNYVKTLGGSNILTDAAILSIQKFYGLAIHRNINSLNEQKQQCGQNTSIYFHVMPI